MGAWYDDKNRVTYLGTYKNDKDARRDLEEAVRRGWTIENTTQDGGHVNLGRTATGAVLTGGLSLLVGGSRSKGSITLVFVRDPASLARMALETALNGLGPTNEKSLKADSDCQRVAEIARTKATEAAANESLGEDREEKNLREALETLARKLDEALKARRELIGSAVAAGECRTAAAALGVTVDSPYVAVVNEVPQFTAKQALEVELLPRVQAAVASQRTAERAAHEVNTRNAKLAEAQNRVASSRAKESNESSRLSSAPPEKLESFRKRSDDAEREVAKRTAEQTAAERVIAEAEAGLREVLEQRRLAFLPLLK